jgi:hypothetical protein
VETMESMRVLWAGVVVVVQTPAAPTGSPLPLWPGPAGGSPHWAGSAAEHDLVLHQVSAWLSGLRQGVQAAPPLPAFQFATPPPRREAAPEDDTPLPGFYL